MRVEHAEVAQLHDFGITRSSSHPHLPGAGLVW
jgi:hypothetical protein